MDGVASVVKTKVRERGAKMVSDCERKWRSVRYRLQMTQLYLQVAVRCLQVPGEAAEASYII